MTKLAFVLDNGRELQVPLASELPLGRLAEVTAAVRDAELQHEERLQSLGLISAHHDRVSTELQRVTSHHQQIASEVHRLQTMESALRQELHSLAIRKEQALNALQDLSGRRAVEEAQLQTLAEKTTAARELLSRTSDSANVALAELDAAGEMLAEAQQQRAQIQTELAARSQELLLSEARLTQACERHVRVSDQHAALVTACEDLALSRDVLEQSQSALETEITRLKTEEQTARQATAEALQAQGEAARLLGETESRLVLSRDESQGLDERITAARRSLDELEAFQSSLAPVVAAQQEKQSQLQTTIRCLEDLFGSRQSALHTTEAALAKAARELAVTRTALDDARQALSEHEGLLRARQDELEGRCHEITDREEELTRLAGVIASQHAVERDAEIRITALTGQIQECQEQLGLDEAKRNAVAQQISTLTENATAAQAELADLEHKLQATIYRAAVVSTRLETTLGEEALAASILAETREKLAAAEGSFADLSPKLDLTRQHLTETSAQLVTAREEHAKLAQEVIASRETLEVQQRTRDAAVQEKQELESMLVSLHQQERDTKARIEVLVAAEKNRRERYDELHSLVDAVEKDHASQRQVHEERLASVLQELGGTESRLAALLAWNERMSECQSRLAGLPEDSLEARNIRNDIQVSMAGLRHLLSPRARAVMPPPLSHPAGGTSDHAGDASMPLASGQAEFPHARSGLTTLRSRGTSSTNAALKEHDKALEDKIRQNEARLELLEARLKRGELEERSQREKVATLKQQLVTLADQISAKAHT